MLVQLTAALVVAAGLIAAERRARGSTLSLSLLRRHGTIGANTAGFALNAAMCSAFFFLALYLQEVGQHSTLQAGLIFTPMTVTALVTSPLGGHAGDRFGPRVAIVWGLLLIGASVGALAWIGSAVSFWLIVPSLVSLGIGIGLTTTPMASLALAAGGPPQAGQAAALLGTSRSVGLALGVSLMGAFVNGTETRASLAPALQEGFAAIAAMVGIAIVVVAITVQHAPSVAESEPARLALEPS